VSLIFVYFLLSAQYESYLVPLSILLSLPVVSLNWCHLSGLENNIYFQVALIMLIGLLAKNAILIVNLAYKGDARNGFDKSGLIGKQASFTSILMTSLAFIFGLLHWPSLRV
jgi:HAE1 family hydrophobic/amphiphilic exporter-1